MVFLGNIQFGITGFPVQRGKRRGDNQGGVRKQIWVRTLEGYDKPGLTLDGMYHPYNRKENSFYLKRRW